MPIHPRLGDGDPKPKDVRPYTDPGDSLNWTGYHHFCLTVNGVDAIVETLRLRGVTIVAEPFELPVISPRLAFLCGPFGNQLAEVPP